MKSRGTTEEQVNEISETIGGFMGDNKVVTSEEVSIELEPKPEPGFPPVASQDNHPTGYDLEPVMSDLEPIAEKPSVVAQTTAEQSDIETIKKLLEQAGHQHKVVIEPTPEMIKAIESTIPRFVIVPHDFPGQLPWENYQRENYPLYKRSEDGSVVVVPEGLGEQPDGTYKMVVTVPEGYISGIETQAEADGVSVETWVSDRLKEYIEDWWGAPKSS